MRTFMIATGHPGRSAVASVPLPRCLAILVKSTVSNSNAVSFREVAVCLHLPSSHYYILPREKYGRSVSLTGRFTTKTVLRACLFELSLRLTFSVDLSCRASPKDRVPPQHHMSLMSLDGVPPQCAGVAGCPPLHPTHTDLTPPELPPTYRGC